MAAKHALLSPSAAERWLHCPPSAALQAAGPDDSSPYAEEGTLAHALAAAEACRLMGWAGLEAELRAEAAPLMERWHTDEMDGYALEWAETVTDAYRAALELDPGALLLLEQRVDAGKWAPGCFGTADALVVRRGAVAVLDFKYGAGVEVRAEGNAQMRLYALGALDLFEEEYGPIAEAEMSIVQPRRQNYSTERLSASELLAWAEETVRPAAALAAKGGGEQAAGDWCRFCRVRGRCSELAAEAWAMLQAGEPPLLEASALARWLPKLGAVRAWADAAEKEAFGMLMRGRTVPGFKLVRGASRRVIERPEEVMARLDDAGYEFGDYAEVKLRGIGALEKLLGKEGAARMLDGLVSKPPGALQIAPEDDRRRAVAPPGAEQTPAEAFGEIF